MAVLELSTDIADLSFSAEKKLSLVQNDGSLKDVQLRGYKKEKNGAELLFDDDVRLILSTTGNEGMTISARLPDPVNAVSAISFPFALSDKVRIEAHPTVPAMELTLGGDTFVFSLPPGSFYAAEERQLRLTTAESAGAIVERTASPDDQLFPLWYTTYMKSVDGADFQKALDGYLDRAYTGWKSGRYRAASGEWKLPGGKYGFSEEAMVAYLAEALKNGSYAPAIAAMTAAAQKHPEAVGFLSSPYLGNLMKVTAKQLSDDTAEALRLKQLIAQKDSSVFETADLVDFMRDRAPEALRKEFFAFCENADYRSASLPAALGMLASSLQSDALRPDEKQAVSRFTNIIGDRLLSSVVPVSDGIYLQDDDGALSPYYSLVGGILIVKAEGNASDGTYSAIGRHLVVSALKLADKDGFIPAKADRRGVPAEGTETVAPERFYTMLTDNPYYPHQISLASQFGGGTWLWTSAPVSIAVKGTEYTFTFDFPAGQIQNFIIEGLSPFKALYLFDTKWRGTSQFQAYPYGYYYNPKISTLHMKIRHKVEHEKVRIIK